MNNVIKKITSMRKTKSRHHDKSYEMTFTLKNSEGEQYNYVRNYDKEGWCFYSSSDWFLFRDGDQKTINEFMSS
tara:strand:- start:57 stop:278 length:222 start_codon:yes stop_codon:yes gene_type:complete